MTWFERPSGLDATFLYSYNGSIGVGLLGDGDKARDLPALGSAMKAALAELVALASEAR